MNAHLENLIARSNELAFGLKNRKVTTLHVLMQALSAGCNYVTPLQSVGVNLHDVVREIKDTLKSDSTFSEIKKITHEEELMEALAAVNMNELNGLDEKRVADQFIDIMIARNTLAYSFLQRVVEGGIGTLLSEIRGFNSSRKFSSRANKDAAVKVGNENDNLVRLEQEAVRSKLAQFETASSETLRIIELEKEQFIKNKDAFFEKVKRDNDEQKKELQSLLRQGAAAKNVADAMTAVRGQLRWSWIWADLVAFTLLVLSVWGFIYTSIYLHDAVQGSFDIIARIKYFMDGAPSNTSGGDMMRVMGYSAFFGSLAKSAACIVFLFVFFKMFSIGLSVFSQCRNKQSMLRSLQAIFSVTNATTDGNLSELIRDASKQILSPIKFNFSKVKEPTTEALKEAVASIKALREAAGGQVDE